MTSPIYDDSKSADSMTVKPVVLFFSRSFYANYFSEIRSEKFESIHATLKPDEAELISGKGCTVCGCFERDFDQLLETAIPDNYLLTSFAADRFLINRTLEERMRILAKEITFWRDIIQRYKPVMVVNETVAIEISEVLAIECAQANIPYHSFLVGIFSPGTTLWKPHPMNGTLGIIPNLEAPIEAKYIETAAAYFDSIKFRSEKPYYIQDFINANRFDFHKIRRELSNDFYRLIYYFRRKYSRKKDFRYENIKRNLFSYFNRYYSSLVRKYDDFEQIRNNSFIFYPLHLEPEATLRYSSEFFDDQCSTIRNIAKTLRTGQLLVVKEHPQQFGMLLTRRFRMLQRENPCIKYIPSELPSETVTTDCEAIVTLTSSAGWEGIIHGKPVVILGKHFWDNYPLAKSAKSYDELRTIIRKADYAFPQDDITKRYIAHLFKNYYWPGTPYPHQQAFNKDNIQGVVYTLEEFIISNPFAL